MALSPTVTEALTEAQSNLRNALAYAARNERPIICETIAKILTSISTIESSESIMEKLDNYKSGDGESPFGKFDF